jgi:hypothetical protein
MICCVGISFCRGFRWRIFLLSKGVWTINWNGQWHAMEVPKKARELLETLDLHIM